MGFTIFLVSTVTHNLVIPASKKDFNNDEDLVFEFTAGVPVEVPKEIGEEYLKCYPHKYKQVYQIIDDVDEDTTSENDVVIDDVNTDAQNNEANDNVDNAETDGFDAVDFLNQNFPIEREKLTPLKQRELRAIAKALELTVPFGSNNQDIINLILEKTTSEENE